MQEEPFGGLDKLDIGDLDAVDVPAAARALIDEAEARIARFERERERPPSFITGNAQISHRLLSWIIAEDLAQGQRFCEWGSGFGVIACLARRLGLEACGIEIEACLVSESRRLAADHALEVRIVEGSYHPEGLAREAVDEQRIGDGLGFSPTDFDIIYVYPWPAEQRLVGYLFREFAAPGALLAVYYGGGRFDLFRQPTVGADRRAPGLRG